jgi:hypothetical protein
LYRNLSYYFFLALFYEKICQSTAQAVIRAHLGDTNRPPNIKFKVPAFFGDRFVDQEGGLRKHNPSATEEGGLEAFFECAALNFDKKSTMILLSGRSNLAGRYLLRHKRDWVTR